MFPFTPVVAKIDGTILVELASLNRAGWVLTGGRSSRMGTDKAFVEIAGRALALRVADAIGKVCGAVTLVGDPVRYAPLGLPVTPDLHPDQGPLAGIEAALSATAAEWNLIVACDTPDLDAGSLDLLFRAAEADESIDIVVPEHSDGRREPLCAVYNRRCAPAAQAALQSGVRKVIEFQSAARLRYLRVEQPEQFANLNTPEALDCYKDARYRNG